MTDRDLWIGPGNATDNEHKDWHGDFYDAIAIKLGEVCVDSQNAKTQSPIQEGQC